MTEEEAQRQQELINEYNRLVAQVNAARHEQAILEAQLRQAIIDVDSSESIVRAITPDANDTMRHMNVKLETEGDYIKECLAVLDDVIDSYFKYKNQSTAAKNITQLYDRYYTQYASYKDLRRVAIGYLIGVNTQLFTTDEPRKLVERVYLMNTEYWLAYAIMSVQLWVSNEREAAERAVRQAVETDERKSNLFYTLVNLRFGRMDAAKMWYTRYFKDYDPKNVNDDFQYLLQALLTGVLGKDRDFEAECNADINTMFERLKQERLDLEQRLVREVGAFFNTRPHVTSKEYAKLGWACPEYQEILNALSNAETNDKLLKEFERIENAEHDKTLPLDYRMENSLFYLIDAYDDEEGEILDSIRFNQMVTEARGDMDRAQVAFKNFMNERNKAVDLGQLMVRYALETDGKIDASVQKFAYEFVRPYIRKAAEEFALSYRKSVKQKYNFDIDGAKFAADENDKAVGEAAINATYKKRAINETMKDKSFKIAAITGFIALAIGIILVAALSNFMPVVVIAVVLFVVFAACVAVMILRAVKIKQHLDFYRNKALTLLQDALSQLSQWRTDFAAADAVNTELLTFLQG